MIYRVVLDDTIDLHTSDINCMLLNPSLDLEMNSAGSFNFTLPPSHPYWNDIKVLKSTIDVYEDGDLIFTGRIASIEKNWNNERVVQCEGALAYFNDSVHRQMKWETPLPIASEDPTVHNFLKDILDNHNVFEGTENANRHIFIGNITVDPEVVTREVNYDTTLDILTRMCIDTNGGYMSIRKDLDDGKLYLDWIKDFTEESGQPAQFGLNLLNFDTSLAAEDICTGVLARGAEVNEQTVMLNNVELVDETTYPDMSVTHYTDKYQDILWHREGVEKFGQVVQVHDFSDAQTAWKDGQGQIVANSLFEMAKKWLEEKNTKIETIEVEVAELAWLGEGMPKYKLGQIVELSDEVHMAGESYETRLLPMYKLSCDLNSGSKKVTLGTPPKKELTQISASNSDSSTLSSSGSSSGSGGSGEGEECRVHDVRVDGTSVVTNKIANISLTGKADVSTVNSLANTVTSLSNTVSNKANTADVNQALAQKQDNLVFNSQDAATAHLTKIKNGNEVYDIPPGTEVEANPTGAATSDLTKLKVGNDIYGIPSGGTTVVANPSETATDDLNTIKIGNTVYDIPGGGSSMMSDYYSTEERVVGRWTDGKPIYQKTLFNVSHGDVMMTNVDTFVNIIVKRHGYGGNSDYIDIGDGYQTNDFISPKLTNGVLYYENWSSTQGGLTKTADVVTIQYTKTTDTPGTGPTPGNLIYLPALYSEEEREVGVWTDGKPLYQKNIPIPTIQSAQGGVIISNLGLNIDTCVDIKVRIYKDTAPDNDTVIATASFGDMYFYYRKSEDSIIMDAPFFWVVGRYGNLTIQYTKTTDQPGSGTWTPEGQLAHHYSTSEKIVGTWIDGSTIYERTIVIDNPVSTGTTTYIAHGIADIETIVDICGGAYLGPTCIDLNSFGSSNYYTLAYADITTFAYELKWGSSTFTKICATLQYTKTS